MTPTNVATLERIVDQELAVVRRRLVHRYLDVDTIDVGNNRAASLSGQRIVLNRHFLRRFADAVPERIVARLLIARLTNRRIRFPKDLREYALMYLAVRERVYSEVPARRILRSLLLLMNDDDLWRRGFARELALVYRASTDAPFSGTGAYWRVLAAALETRWGVSLGAMQRLGPVHVVLARRLAALPYEDRERRQETAGEFARLVSTMFRFVTPKIGRGVGSTRAGAKKQPEKPPVWPLGGDDDGVDPGDLGEIGPGVSTLLGELSEEGLGELLLEAFSAGISGVGLAGAGRWWWYQHLAKRYDIPIAPRSSTQEERAYPVERRAWSIGDPVDTFDPIASYGRLLPSIAKRRLYTGGESEYSDARVPDLVVAIDSSGSMRNPNQHKSFAVLAACVAARSYLGNRSSVAVLNFSSGVKLLGFSNDEAKVLQQVCTYQGGGTTLRIDALDGLLESRSGNDRPVDLLVITDMGIMNIGDVVARISEYEGTHRVFVFHVQCTAEQHAAARARFAALPHVELHRIEVQEDLPEVVLGRVARSIRGEPGDTAPGEMGQQEAG